MAHGLLVVTDLDGTLLDHDTYAHVAAREALDALRDRAIPLVLATSKTRAEVDALASRLPQGIASIVENGGAVLVPAGSFTHPPARSRRDGDVYVIELGVTRDALVRHLDAIASETGVRLSGFASMPVARVAELTGLPPAAAALACERQYDEPFLIEDTAALPRVAEAARRRGLQVTQGGRFLHLLGADTGKGRALRALLAAHAAEGRHFTTVGLGDAANDRSMLAAVDRPVIVPRHDGTIDPELAAALPRSERAPLPGPTGWNAAVLTILAGGQLPRVAADHP
jgi:mannosyl-3-phosphoglycerate phosphatase